MDTKNPAAEILTQRIDELTKEIKYTLKRVLSAYEEVARTAEEKRAQPIRDAIAAGTDMVGFWPMAELDLSSLNRLRAEYDRLIGMRDQLQVALRIILRREEATETEAVLNEIVELASR